MQILLPFHWWRSPPRDLQKLSTNNGLPMLNVVQLCLAANHILLMRKWNHIFSPSCDCFYIKMAKWQMFIRKQTRWPNDKTIYYSTRLSQNIVIYYTLYSISVFSLAKNLQLTLVISPTYRLVSYLLADNWLICRLCGQCMISKSNGKLFFMPCYVSPYFYQYCV